MNSLRFTRLLALAIFALLFTTGAQAAVSSGEAEVGTLSATSTFSLAQSSVRIALAPSFNQLPVRIAITPAQSGFNFAALTTQSDSSWVAPAVDASTGEIVLTFSTTALLNSSYTATITLTHGGHTETLSVVAGVSPLNIVSLLDDPTRSRMYALHQNGSGPGSLLIFDPLTALPLGSLSLGDRPADMAIKHDGTELVVLCAAGKQIWAIDLQTLSLREVLSLTFGEWGTGTPSGHIAYGPGNIIYYVDGTWAPTLRAFNRSTKQVIQTVLTAGGSDFGFGDIAVTPDKTALYAWAQYGWSAGNAGSYVARHPINPDGTLGAGQRNNASYPNFLRDPLETPTLISADGDTVIAKTLVVDPASITTTLRTFATPVYAMSPGAEIVSTATAIHELSTGNQLFTLPVSTKVQAMTSDYARLVYFNSTNRSLGTVNLIQTIGAEILGRTLSPADGAIVLPPTSLSWSPLPGIDRYHVYLGTSSASVASATPASGEYLGEITSTTFTLPHSLQPGTTYYWRADAVAPSETTAGAIHTFQVSSLSSSVAKITGATVRGHADYLLPTTLNSVTPGQTWTATSPDSWVGFVENTGTTPATLQVRLDASNLVPGLHRSTVQLTGTGGTVTIPVELQVDPLALTVIKNRPGTTKVYAISEDTSATGSPRAYLLELDSLFKSITRVTRAGTGVTDIAVHEADGRVYVTNWQLGSLLAINLGTFSLERTYAMTVPGSYRDAYRISAGRAGRLIYEPQDQWVYIGIFNTETGATLSTSFEREGGGIHDPSGRYYYHGDNNSSGAQIHKLDTVGDVFLKTTSNPTKGIGYYGSRTVVMSEDGRRIFYNGLVYDPNLTTECNLGAIIYSTSADGRFAFGQNTIFDVVTQQAVLAMPAATTVSAYNAATGRLVLQNGAGVEFFSLAQAGLIGTGLSPGKNAIIHAPELLAWNGMPAATGYRVYLGTSLAAVTAAGLDSPEFLGTFTATNIPLNDILAAGHTYYWRVDYVIGDQVAAGELQSFTVVNVAPAQTDFALGTVQGDVSYPIDIALSSAVDGTAWTASPSVPWLQLQATSGTIPATLRVAVDVPQLQAGPNAGIITVTSGGVSSSINISMHLDPMTLKALQSDPGSSKVYAISEAPVTAGASRAYLLEIDTATESITRVVRVGTGATDLALHAGDNRIYVPNWLIGSLYAVGLDDFTVDRIYTVPGFAGTGYSNKDVYLVSAGGPGRLIVEAEDQWINVSIFDTQTGKVLASVGAREGGGAHDPSGRYYFHGDNNSSGAEIHKFDTLGDQFLTLAHRRVSTASYYGSRVVLVSEDGSRVFWNGSVFDAALVEQWAFAKEVYSITPNGRYAFGETSIYDTVAQQLAFGMPVGTRVSAYNGTSGKLVVQTPQGLGYFPLNAGQPLPAPVLSSGAITTTSAVLAWNEKSLETAFTLQRRVSGTTAWTDVSSTLPQNSTTHTVTGLASNTTYEFRIKATATSVSSPWSNTVTVITPTAPLPIPTALNSSASTTDSVTLSWTLSGSGHDAIVIERSLDGISGWSPTATLPAAARSYTDAGLQPGTTYYYRLVTSSGDRTSGSSTVLGVTTPSIVLATAPTMVSASPSSGDSIRINWTARPAASGHRIERQIDGQNEWHQIANLPSDTSSFIDPNLQLGVRYWYRLRAYNDHSVSDYSSVVSAVVRDYVTVLSDTFTGAAATNTWQSIAGANVFNGGPGFNNSDVLWFGLSGPRHAVTNPVDLRGGGHLTFSFRAGNRSVDGPYWDNSELGEAVTLEYSIDGTTWVPLQTLLTHYPHASSWSTHTFEVPTAARTMSTAFRWRQGVHSGANWDTWALDNVFLESVAASPTAPEFISASAIADTQIAIFWFGATGASTYVIERSTDGATWTPLAISSNASPYYTDTSCTPSTWYAYRIKTVNIIGESAPSTIAWARTYRPMDYWRLSNYGSPEATGAAAPLERDFDQVTNLEKFAYGLVVGERARSYAPESGRMGLPRIWMENSTYKLRAEFLRRKPNTNSGVRYQVEFSDDMMTWAPGGVIIEQTSIDSVWEHVCYEDTEAPKERRFARVKLIQD